jgi:hypothetical protein
MMSGHVAEMETAAAEAPNVVAAIPKPFFSEALLKAVERVLETGALASVPAPPPLPLATPVAESIPPPDQALTNGKHHGNGRKPAALPVATQAATEQLKVEEPPRFAPVWEPAPEREQELTARTTQGEVAMTLSLTINSVQLTPQFRMGALRVRPASSVAALRVESAAVHAGCDLQAGFDLGAVRLTQNGTIDTITLVPTQSGSTQPVNPSGFEIGCVAIAPDDAAQGVRLISSGSAPMTVQATGHFELAAVELSVWFEVAALVLKSTASRFTLVVPKDGVHSGSATADFEIARVELSSANRIDELLLNPVP